MNYLWLLAVFATVTIVTADVGEDRASILKRLVEALEDKNEDKRAMQLITYDSSKGSLKIQFQVCVIGDRGKIPCRKRVTGHSWKIYEMKPGGGVTKIDSGKVKYLVVDPTLGGRGPSKEVLYKFRANFIYRVVACELLITGTENRCNTADFKGDKSGSFYPSGNSPNAVGN